MKKLVAIASPIALAFFAACGGGGDSPPPLASNPETTPEIKCADARLDDALKKCKSGIADKLPLLLASSSNNGEGGNGNSAALLQLILANKKKDETPPAAPAPNQDPSCPKPQVDKETSCNDDLITALLLWKSAPKKDNSLAIYDQFYKQYLMMKLKGFINQSGREMGLNEQQGRLLADKLKNAFITNTLSQSGLTSGESGALASVLNGGGLNNLLNGGGLNNLLNGGGLNNLLNRGVKAGTKPSTGGNVTSATSGSNGNGVPRSGLSISYSDPDRGGGRGLTSDAQQASSGVIPLSELRRAARYGLPSSSINRKPTTGQGSTGP